MTKSNDGWVPVVMDQRLYERMLDADKSFMAEKGIGASLEKYDARLKAEVKLFNKDYGTKYDPKESLHDYLELAEVRQ
jgi:hypothetical protein